MRIPRIVLSAVILVVFTSVQPAQAEQQPDTLLRGTIEQLLDELRSNRSEYEGGKCQLYSMVRNIVLPNSGLTRLSVSF